MHIPVPVLTIGLLILSNEFMTFAWYGHLKFKTLPLAVAILISWGIALFEYVLMVPANRWGYGYFNAAQLKTIQEVITLTIFMVFSALWLGEPLRWNRVNDLPDFVYFNHSIHVHKGIGCQTCHGEVDNMPLVYQHASLQMRWCLDCHRNPEDFVRPREEVFNMDWSPASRGTTQAELGAQLVAEYAIEGSDNCSIFHR